MSQMQCRLANNPFIYDTTGHAKQTTAGLAPVAIDEVFEKHSDKSYGLPANFQGFVIQYF